MNHKLTLAMFTLIAFSGLAAQLEGEPTITASAELGALYKTGNTKSGDIKAGLEVRHEKGQWRNSAKFDLLVRKTEELNSNDEKEFNTTDQKWSLDGKTNYTLEGSSKNYLYGNAYYSEDRFNGFDSQSTISAGWGRRWIDTETTTLDADIGPGFKRDVLEETETTPKETMNSFIIQAQGLYTHQINEHVEFKQFLSAKYAPKSGENSIYKSESSITSKLIETLQIKFAFTVDLNTEVEQDRKKTDTQTSITLVYSF